VGSAIDDLFERIHYYFLLPALMTYWDRENFAKYVKGYKS